MIKIPLALAKAAEASFPTFVEDGRLCFKILRTHARGGSNSTEDGGAPFDSPALAFSFAGGEAASDFVGLMVWSIHFSASHLGCNKLVLRAAEVSCLTVRYVVPTYAPRLPTSLLIGSALPLAAKRLQNLARRAPLFPAKNDRKAKGRSTAVRCGRPSVRRCV